MLRVIVLLAALLAAWSAVGSGHAQERRPRPIALIGATIVDGAGGAPIADGVVLIAGDRILAVGPRGDVRIPGNAERIDATGRWITPGLIDAHVHFFQSGGLYTRPDVFDLRATRSYADDLAQSKARLDDTFARYLASGVTSVVDAGGPLWNFEVRDLAARSAAAPRVAVAGPLIATEPTPRQQRLALDDPPILSAAGPEEAAALARAQLPRKPDLIKIWGIGADAAGVERVRAITAAVADVAHAAGVRVAVHATSLENARAALEAGADILVHSVDDAPVDAAFIAALQQRGAVYVTTLMVNEGYQDAARARPDLTTFERRLAAPEALASLYEAPSALRERQELRAPESVTRAALANARALAAVGARVAAGTDAGNIGTLHGPALHRELQLLAAAGLSPAQALTAATRDAAFAFSAKPDIGLVAAGYRADLLVLDADPLADVRNLQRIRQVWSRGRRHDPATLIPASPEQVVQRQLDAYNAQDIEGFVATYAPDAEIFGLPPTQPRLSGHDALRAQYADLFARLPELRCAAVNRIVQGAYVIDQEVCHTGASPPVLRATAVYQVDNGLIRRVWFAQ